MIDGRFRQYEEGLINQLVVKYDSQPRDSVEFYHPNVTTELLMKGNSALVTLWDAVLHEVSEVLIQSCDIHAFVDDYMQLNYGYNVRRVIIFDGVVVYPKLGTKTYIEM